MAERRAWLPFTLVILSVAAEMVLAGTPVEVASRPALITAIVGLAVLAMGVSLVWSMGLGAEPRGFRLVMIIPVAFACVTAVVLILEADWQTMTGAL